MSKRENSFKWRGCKVGRLPGDEHVGVMRVQGLGSAGLPGDKGKERHAPGTGRALTASWLFRAFSIFCLPATHSIAVKKTSCQTTETRSSTSEQRRHRLQKYQQGAISGCEATASCSNRMLGTHGSVHPLLVPSTKILRT